jgi:hypothetical protein
MSDGKGKDKGELTVNGKKIVVGPSRGFDQGSAYDAMNSETDGKGDSGSGTFGGSYSDDSETMPQPGE